MGSVLVAAILSSADQWQPVTLVLVLATLMIFSDIFSVRVGEIWVSAAGAVLLGAMALLGPGPAVALGVGSQILVSFRDWRGWGPATTNVSTHAVFVLAGSVMLQQAGAKELAQDGSWLTVPLVLGVFLVTNLLNFWLIALDLLVTERLSVRTSIKTVYLPVLPADFAIALVTGAAVLGYYLLGAGAVALLVLVALTFQSLLRTVLESQQRGEALERRTRELSALQVGLLSTVLQTLSLRDAMTARHSAAVARYAREMARELGMTAEEQDLVHTAALLHDIGKFIFPDSILFAARRLTDDEFNIVRKHPEQGARLVERIEGYGPVAEIIRAHHERIDGQGYPRRLEGDQIPLASRIISIADTYDVMTARDSYREPVSPEMAIEELRRVSGTQLDGRLVDVFVGLLKTRGVKFRHSDDADFEAELSFEKRVRDYARPRMATA